MITRRTTALRKERRYEVREVKGSGESQVWNKHCLLVFLLQSQVLALVVLVDVSPSIVPEVPINCGGYKALDIVTQSDAGSFFPLSLSSNNAVQICGL